MAFPQRIRNAFAPATARPLDPGTSPELFKQTVQEILSGKEHSAETHQIGQAIKAHFKEQLKARKQIAPGLFSTGFADIAVKTDDGITPDGTFDTTNEGAMHQILAKTLEHVESNPHGTPPSDVITLNQVLHGLPPTPGAPFLPPDMPLHGTDALGNKLVVILGGHPHMKDVADATKAHHGEDLHCGDDTWAWARATWMSVLMQRKPEELAKAISDLGPEFSKVAEIIEELAKALQNQGPEAIIARQTSSENKETFTIKWPESVIVGELPQDCEVVLKHLTSALTTKSLQSAEIRKLPKDAPLDNAKICLLTSLLGGESAVLTNRPPADERSKSNGGMRTICLSNPINDTVIENLSALEVDQRAQQVYLHMTKLPLIVQHGVGYSIAFPCNPPVAPEEDSSVSDNDPVSENEDDSVGGHDHEETVNTPSPLEKQYEHDVRASSPRNPVKEHPTAATNAAIPKAAMKTEVRSTETETETVAETETETVAETEAETVAETEAETEGRRPLMNDDQRDELFDAMVKERG